LLLVALLALENPPKLLSNAFHDVEKMPVRQLRRSREELQYGLKPSLCVQRKIEGSVESKFQQDWRPRFQQDWLARLVSAVRNVRRSLQQTSRPFLTVKSLVKQQYTSCCFMSEWGAECSAAPATI